MKPIYRQHISPISQSRRLVFTLVMSLMLLYTCDVTLRESTAQLANTQIVFETVIGVLPNWEIYAINADGTNHVRLTKHPEIDRYPCWSPDGSKIAFTSTRDGNFEIYVMNADGTHPVNLTHHPRQDSFPTWSPDGTKIAFESWRDFNQPEIYVMNADGTHPVNLTFHLQPDTMPSWSPDGTKIAFVSRRTRFDANLPLNEEIYVMNADDGANLIRLTFSPFTDWFPSWSPDGTKIAFMSDRNDEDFEIYVMNADGTNPVNLTNHPSNEERPSWSPDGTKIAFASARDGDSDIYVMNADGTHPVRLTNNRVRDLSPSWSPIFPPFAVASPKEKRLTLWGQIKAPFR